MNRPVLQIIKYDLKDKVLNLGLESKRRLLDMKDFRHSSTMFQAAYNIESR